MPRGIHPIADEEVLERSTQRTCHGLIVVRRWPQGEIDGVDVDWAVAADHHPGCGSAVDPGEI